MTAKAVFSGFLPNPTLQKPALHYSPGPRVCSNSRTSYLDPAGLTPRVTWGSWDVGWQLRLWSCSISG